MELIHNEEVDILYILPLFPPPRQHVPVLGSTDDDITLLHSRGEREGGMERGRERERDREGKKKGASEGGREEDNIGD